MDNKELLVSDGMGGFIYVSKDIDDENFINIKMDKNWDFVKLVVLSQINHQKHNIRSADAGNAAGLA